MPEQPRPSPAALALLGLLALVVPALAIFVAAHQASVPLLGIYVDTAQPPAIVQVLPRSSAWAAGLRAGDTILAVDGRPYADFLDRRLGQAYRFTIVSGGSPRELSVPLGPMLPANLLQLGCAAFTALLLWGTGLLLLGRIRSRDALPLFLLFQACGVAELIGLAYPRFWLPYPWLVSLEVSALVCAAPLLLHHQLTLPRRLGSARRRRWLFGVLYALTLAGVVDVCLRPVPWTSPAVFGAVFVGLLSIGAGLFVYFRRASADERRRMRVAVAGTVLGLAPPIVAYVLPTAVAGYTPAIPRWLVSLFVAVVPLSYLAAVVRHNLYGIDLLLNRALVYSILSLGVFALYLGPFLVLYNLMPGRWLPQMIVVSGLTLVTALTFSETRTQVQRGVDRLFYGGWYDYPGVVESVSAALARSREWAEVAGILAGTVPAAMQLQAAQVVVGPYATPPLAPGLKPGLELPLICGDQGRGVWILGPRRDGESFTAADRRILQTLACEAEIALTNTLLLAALRGQLAEVRASRAISLQFQHRLLRSREEERARLARDLHDGPIQALVGLHLQLAILASRTRQGGDGWQEMRAQVHDLIGELRRTCTELRPPMLDTVGLGAALRALAGDWSAQRGVDVHLDLAPDATLRGLPEEVAVNFYRVAQEALSNVARHAEAHCVDLHLRWDAASACLALTIRDDGRGFANTAIAELAGQGHFGLAGIRERMELIGGRCQIEAAPGQGTTLSVAWQSEGHAG